MTLLLSFRFTKLKIGSMITMASLDPAISVLYSTLDILILFQTRSRSWPCYCVLQTNTPSSDHVLFCLLIEMRTPLYY